MVAAAPTVTGDGPWLSWVGANWMGYVNPVNSHKPGGAATMEGPYFGNAERDFYQYWKSR